MENIMLTSQELQKAIEKEDYAKIDEILESQELNPKDLFAQEICVAARVERIIGNPEFLQLVVKYGLIKGK